jgi:hypothetical protein
MNEKPEQSIPVIFPLTRHDNEEYFYVAEAIYSEMDKGYVITKESADMVKKLVSR